MGFHGVKVKSILQLCKYFSFFLLYTSPWPSCREVDGGGWIAIADSRTVAVCPFPASPWDGSPSMAADAAWGFVWPSHGSMVWHRYCQHIQVKEGGGWIAIADSRTVAVVSVPASPWDGSPSTVADAAWGFVWPSHGSMVWHRYCQHIQVKEGGGWIAIADSRTVAVVSVPASPWDGSPSTVADAAWGFVCAFHGSMVWH